MYTYTRFFSLEKGLILKFTFIKIIIRKEKGLKKIKNQFNDT